MKLGYVGEMRFVKRRIPKGGIKTETDTILTRKHWWWPEYYMRVEELDWKYGKLDSPHYYWHPVYNYSMEEWEEVKDEFI